LSKTAMVLVRLGGGFARTLHYSSGVYAKPFLCILFIVIYVFFLDRRIWVSGYVSPLRQAQAGSSPKAVKDGHTGLCGGP
jgi:hypothetical protein